MSTDSANDAHSVDLADTLGAEASFSVQCFTIYIPNKDKDDQEFGTQRKWVLEAIELLSAINGGATAIPVEGGWKNEEGRLILEDPVVVYSYIANSEQFAAQLPLVRKFLHRMGFETNQGEIAFEFNGEFYRIRKFDSP